MFDVAIVFFSSVANMCKKANELIHKQQISMQVRLIRRQQRPALSQCGIWQAFMINFILVIFCRHEAMLTNRLRRKSTNKKKIQIKAWYRILRTQILSYEEFHCKTTQISEVNELYPAKWNSLDSLACNLMSNLCSFIFEAMLQVLVLLAKVCVKDHVLL